MTYQIYEKKIIKNKELIELNKYKKNKKSKAVSKNVGDVGEELDYMDFMPKIDKEQKKIIDALLAKDPYAMGYCVEPKSSVLLEGYGDIPIKRIPVEHLRISSATIEQQGRLSKQKIVFTVHNLSYDELRAVVGHALVG